MNRRPNQSPDSHRQKSGVALVTVLALLVLLSALILLFMDGVTRYRVSSHQYASGSAARVLADSAVSLVIGQVRDATTVPDMAWASQPGLIRTYAGDRSLAASYKLYSSSEMVDTSGNADFIQSDVPADWDSPANASRFVDLNSPAVTRATSGQISTHYPILDPAAASLVEGLEINGAGTNSAAMPVQWLYIFADGTIGTQDKASKANPITGRFAFWTDDESTKININTAGEGSPWDTPRVANAQERGTEAVPGYAWSWPARGEFQRYPGHPAMTSLSAAFGNLLEPDEILQLIPRLQPGGSRRGTIPFRAAREIFPDTNPLYATVDELIFTPEREMSHPSVTKEVIDRLRFVLTASSRAPETTLSNQPRVSIWPVAEDPQKRTPLDELLAMSATVGDEAFYVQRANANSATVDAAAGNNPALYNFLNRSMQRPFPGFGDGTFASKYGADQPQILTQIFDAIRCTNLVDRTASEVFTSNLQTGSAHTITRSTRGQVNPLEMPNGTRGFGRFPTVNSANLIFFWTYPNNLSEPPPANPNPNLRITTLRLAVMLELTNVAQGDVAMIENRVIVLTGLNSFRVNGQSLSFHSDSFTSNFNMPLSTRPSVTSTGGQQGLMSYLAANTSSPVAPPGLYDSPGLEAANSRYRVPVSGAVTVTGPTFSFSGGRLTATISAPWETPSQVGGEQVQEIILDFPAATLPVPERQVLRDGSIVPGDVLRFWHQSSQSTRTMTQFDNPGPTQGQSIMLLNANDTVRGLVYQPGDTRMISALKRVERDPAGTNYFTPHPDYFDSSVRHAHSISSASQAGVHQGGTFGSLVEGISAADYMGSPPVSWRGVAPQLPKGVDGVRNVLGNPGDWDSATGAWPDGPWINKTDDGPNYNGATNDPYFNTSPIDGDFDLDQLFSPNRMVASPVQFGSLPSGVKRNHPWQTLLFRPDRAEHPGSPGHPGSVGPPDHLLLDLFWMPVVEPYAISEPFSTAGKINLNYQIVPFTNIKRATGMHALLKASRIAAVPQSIVLDYKRGSSAQTTSSITRHEVDIDKTLQFFEDRFQAGEAFLSASEICDVPLVPKGPEDDLVAFWNNHLLTGDNLRERPYSDLYARATTKSNTFTVHVCAQSLQKIATDPDQDVWKEDRDLVLAEFRGSFVIERYLDPNVDAFDLSDPNAQLGPYKFRILSVTQFAP